MNFDVCLMIVVVVAILAWFGSQIVAAKHKQVSVESTAAVAKWRHERAEADPYIPIEVHWKDGTVQVCRNFRRDMIELVKLMSHVHHVVELKEGDSQ